MTQVEQQRLKRIQGMLWLAIGLLLVAEVGTLLQGTVNYLITMVIAACVFIGHWLTRKRSSRKLWQKYLAMLLPVFSILAPLAYFIFKVFISDAAVLWFQLVLLAGFVAPLLLMFYVNRLLGQLISTGLVSE